MKILTFTGDALLQQSLLQQQQQPNPQALAFLQRWMKRPSMGCVYLLGRDSDIWEKPDLQDLIAIKPQESDGLFSAWIVEKFLRRYHQTVGRHFRVRTLDRIHDQRVEVTLTSIETRCYRLLDQYSPVLPGRSTASGRIDHHERRLHIADCCHERPVYCR